MAVLATGSPSFRKRLANRESRHPLDLPVSDLDWRLCCRRQSPLRLNRRYNGRVGYGVQAPRSHISFSGRRASP